MADADGFCVVQGKKASRFRQQRRQISSAKLTMKEDGSFNFQDFKKRLDNCIQEISMTQFFSSNIEKITSAMLLISHKKTSDSQESARVVIQDPSHNVPSSNDVPTPHRSCLTNTTSNILHQHHLVPEGNQSNNLEPDILTSVERLSLSSDEEEGEEGIHIFSYGLGSFVNCVAARYQLAFLLAVRNTFEAKCTACYVYDPVFTSQEKMVLESYHCQVISENEEGKRECTKPTLAFLPHCGKALYNNLLWRNLATHDSVGLSRLALIGNSFSSMVERTPKRTLNKTGNYLLQLSPHIMEVHLDNTFTHKDIFNDLSIHYFLGPQLAAALHSIGPQLDEPVYEGDDAEFIAK